MDLFSSGISSVSGRTSEVSHPGKPKRRGDRSQENDIRVDKSQESNGHTQRQYRDLIDHSATKHEKDNNSSDTHADKPQTYVQDRQASETDCHFLDARV